MASGKVKKSKVKPLVQRRTTNNSSSASLTTDSKSDLSPHNRPSTPSTPSTPKAAGQPTSPKPNAAAAGAKKKGKKRPKQSWFDRMKKKCMGAGDRVALNRRSTEIVDGCMLNATELLTLRAKFDDIDVDGAGELYIGEFFESVDEPRTAFTDLVFTLLDDPQTHVKFVTSEEQEKARKAAKGAGGPRAPAPPVRVMGKLSWDDFVQGARWLTFLCAVTFQAFDKDKSGVIDEEEFVDLCATVNNMNPTFPGNFVKAMTEFDKNDDGMIDFDEFRLLNRRYPSVLFPIFRLQDRLQEYTLGHDGWVSVAQRLKREDDAAEYRKMHNGQLPPVPFFERLGRSVCCCFFKEPIPGYHTARRTKPGAAAVAAPKVYH